MNIVDIVEKLPHSGEYKQRTLDKITTIVIHHSASPAGKFTPYDFAKWHMSGAMKAPRIAYHFAIEPDGTVYQTNKLTSVSWHASNANSYSIGVELNGDFTKEHPTKEQLNSLKELISYLEIQIGHYLEVKGHKEVDVTACPGPNMMVLKNNWRK